LSLLIPASALPHAPRALTTPLHCRGGRSPTTQNKSESAASAAGLAPVDCRRTRTRPVSYYALFQGWLLLSQPPGCPRARTSLHTRPALGGLSRRSRLFPSRPRSLAPVVSLPRHPAPIRRLPGVGSLDGPSPQQRATWRGSTRDAAPQCISGRTSYLRVRLAFHPYPQLLQPLCNAGRFGPPRGCPPASPWPWVAHPVSGLPGATHTPVWGCLALLGLACAPAPGLVPLNHAAPGQLAGSFFNRHAVRARRPLRPTARSRFQALFHPPRRGPFHRSLTVLLRYGSPEVRAPWDVVVPASRPVPRAGRYSRTPTTASNALSPTGLSPAPGRRSRRFG
jgi:hypothetical protein